MAFLEAFGVPFVGTGLDLIAMSKAARKKLVAFHKLPTPNFLVIKDSKKNPEHSLKYPLFAKSVRDRGSAGISGENVVEHPEDLPKVIDKITHKIGQSALMEEFISDREIVVGVVGNNNPGVLPILEIGYNSAITNTYKHKMLDNEIINCPADFSKAEEDRIKDTVKKIYKILNAKDFGRVDMIIAEDGTPYFLELNTFAGLTMSSGKAHNGYMGYMAEAINMSATDFMGSIVKCALERYSLKQTHALTS